MFDVSWTDPARETVGERRNRKEQNGGSTRKQSGISRRSSMRSSNSSETAGKPSLLKILSPSTGKKVLNRAGLQQKYHLEDANDRRLSSYTTGSETSGLELSSTTTTTTTTTTTRDPENEFFEGRDGHSDTEQSNPSEPPDSVFSGWTEKSSRTESSWGSVVDTSTICSGTSSCIVQPLSPNSFVTQSTEVIISPRDSIKAEEQVATTVRITAAATMPVQMQNNPDSSSKTASPPSTFAFPLPLPLSYAYPPLTTSPSLPDLSHLSARLETKSKQALNEELKLSLTELTVSSASCSSTQTIRWPTNSSSRDRIRELPPLSKTWKPPETWECPASYSDSSNCSVSPTAMTHPRPRVHRSPRSPPPAPSTLAVVPRRSKERSVQKPRQISPSAPIEILHLQRNIRRMEAASKKIMLERLREEWTEIADASVYRELELEKQMWMLTALRSFDGHKSVDGLRCRTPVFGEPRGLHRIVEGGSERRKRVVVTEQRGKVLSLYENHASASSLAAMVAKGAEMHHLSTAPLSAKQYPNVLPLTVPSATSHLPYASNIFSSVHAFSLPYILPSSSIPTVLRECHRVLSSAPVSQPSQSPSPTSPIEESQTKTSAQPLNMPTTSADAKGGSLHLTVLDPSPLPATLGPRLRTWLDDNLILNLEKQFRCINPSRLFPDWLADAGLRTEGSTVMYVKFFASVPSVAWSRCSSTAISRREDDDDRDLNTMDEFEKEKHREKEMEDNLIKQELKSVVGRMLWKEMWGPHVQGEKWWWEDETIIDECERMGTVWEYAAIEAVKGQ